MYQFTPPGNLGLDFLEAAGALVSRGESGVCFWAEESMFLQSATMASASVSSCGRRFAASQAIRT